MGADEDMLRELAEADDLPRLWQKAGIPPRVAEILRRLEDRGLIESDGTPCGYRVTEAGRSMIS